MAMKNKTRRALVLSVLSLILCCSMLVGTTFAWFTDSVSNGINKIESGNLDIELYHLDFAKAAAASPKNVGLGIPKDVKGEKVGADTKLFLNEEGKPILWEPGATAVESFRIKNEGSLALKYQFSINFANATKTPQGKTLADIINISASKIEYNEFGVPFGTDDVDNLDDRPLGDGYSFEKILLPGEEYNFWVGLQWVPSNIDNEFNVKGGLDIDLGVTLVATQHTYEKDNYYEGDQYDKDASQPTASPLIPEKGTPYVGDLIDQPSGTDYFVAPKDLQGNATATLKRVFDSVIYEDVTANLNGDMIISETDNTILLHNCNITIPEGAKLIKAVNGATVGQVMMHNITVNGELLTQATAAQYLEGVNFYQVW